LKDGLDTTKKNSEGIAYCYARVSTLGQAEDGMSLGAQEKQLIASAELAGYEAIILREEGRSGKNIQGRPVLRKALDDLDQGKAQALYVTRLDRLARSTRDFLTIVDRSHKFEWRLALLDLGLDTATYQGRFVVTIMAAMAEMERGMISLRQRDVHEDRRSQGMVWGKTIGPKSVLDDAVKQKIWDSRNSGMSFNHIAEQLNIDGTPTTNKGKQWYASTVRHVFIAFSKDIA
jgi:DNA invertase Pin-like site-specific DNA recombinase